MTELELQDFLYQFVSMYFRQATVAWSLQSEPKPNKSSVLLQMSALRYIGLPHIEIDDGVPYHYYEASGILEVSLYTNGKAAFSDVAYSSNVNTAVNDLMQFVLFVGSPMAINFMNQNDITILPKPSGDEMVQDISAILDDSSYEYRARTEFIISFVLSTDGLGGNRDVNASGGGGEGASGDTGWFEKVNISQKKEG